MSGFVPNQTVINFLLAASRLPDVPRTLPLNTSPIYTVEMCLPRTITKGKYPFFLYKFIGRENAVKCYKFRSRILSRSKPRYTNKNFPILCAGCEISYHQSRANGEQFEHSLKTRKTDGFKMLSNPHDGHVPGCIPMDYELVILQTSPVTDVVRNKIIRGEDISMHRKPPGSLFSYTLPLHPHPTTSYHGAQSHQANKKVQMARPMEFKKSIVATMFNEDDAEVSVEEGNMLRVVFERKITSFDRSRSSFRHVHEFDLPDYVDRDTIYTSWGDGILIVHASTKNNGSFE